MQITHTETPDGYLRLEDFPVGIARATIALDNARVDLDDTRQAVADLEIHYKEQAAYNDDLTNETKRRAYVEEQKQTDPAYGDAQHALALAEKKVRDLEREHRRVTDQFAVAKLVYERGTALVAAGLPGLVYDLPALGLATGR